MTSELKKRIADINSGIIPEGYKKTKVGIVPVEWEVCRLSNYLYVNKEKNTELKYDKQDVFSISGEYGIVNQIEFLGRSYAGGSVEPYRIVYPQNIVYTKSPLKINPYGIIKSNQTNKTGIVSTLYAVYHCKDNTLSKYVEYYFGIDTTLNNYLLPLVNIGSKHDMKISDENVLSGYVSFPPLPEQQKIAEILSTQDKLIELQEKKIEKLKELKKAYLQKMFPKKGSKFPELRFKGFTEEWKKHSLSEITSKIGSGKTPSGGKSSYINDGICLIRSQNIHDNNVDLSDVVFIDEITNNDMANSQVFKNDVLLNITGASIGRSAVYKEKRQANVNQHVCIIRSKNDYDPMFIQLNISSHNGQRQIEYNQAGGGREGINFQQIGKIHFMFPSKEEQSKIAEFFSFFDKKLSLSQRKLVQEKQKKKALMQLLLTGKVRCK